MQFTLATQTKKTKAITDPAVLTITALQLLYLTSYSPIQHRLLPARLPLGGTTARRNQNKRHVTEHVSPTIYAIATIVQSVKFLNRPTNISQSSAAKCLRCGGILRTFCCVKYLDLMLPFCQ